MEEKKNSKGIIWLIVILIFLVLALMGYVIYDKVILDNNTNENNTTTTTVKQNDTKIISIENFPQSNDDTVLSYGNLEDMMNLEIDYKKNYQNESLNYRNLEFIMDCTDYQEVNQIEGQKFNWCYNIQIKLNNQVLYNINEDPIAGDGNSNPYMLLTENYIIFQNAAGLVRSGEILIYDYQGNLLKEIKNTTNETYVGSCDEETTDYETSITIVDNKLYFVEYIENDNYNTAFKYLDLSKNLEETVIEKFNALQTQEC